MEMKLSQFKRYEKQIIIKKIGLAGQKKISSASVLILGMGGLGCPLLTYLAASGVGKIGIVDFDKVEISNLNRQTLFNFKDIGKFKVNQAKKAIYKINKNIKVIPFNKKLSHISGVTPNPPAEFSTLTIMRSKDLFSLNSLIFSIAKFLAFLPTISPINNVFIFTNFLPINFFIC